MPSLSSALSCICRSRAQCSISSTARDSPMGTITWTSTLESAALRRRGRTPSRLRSWRCSSTSWASPAASPRCCSSTATGCTRTRSFLHATARSTSRSARRTRGERLCCSSNGCGSPSQWSSSQSFWRSSSSLCSRASLSLSFSTPNSSPTSSRCTTRSSCI
eukprot:Amastigsp_a356436_4.p4 type:complete len:162 gc:universal Amastigsp_a356436_4:135-620(+)